MDLALYIVFEKSFMFGRNILRFLQSLTDLAVQIHILQDYRNSDESTVYNDGPPTVGSFSQM